MNSADIVTGQFVRIRQTPASVGDRIVERLIDMAAIISYAIGLSYLLSTLPIKGDAWEIVGILLLCICMKETLSASCLKRLG